MKITGQPLLLSSEPIHLKFRISPPNPGINIITSFSRLLFTGFHISTLSSFFLCITLILFLKGVLFSCFLELKNKISLVLSKSFNLVINFFCSSNSFFQDEIIKIRLSTSNLI